MSRVLPQHPNLEFLRKQAKSLLVELQQRNATAQLSDAQHALAREYGFASWPKLKAFVDAQSTAGSQSVSALAGTWKANLEKSRRHPGNPFRSDIIEIDVLGDRFTITDTVVDETGREETATPVILADGKPIHSAIGLNTAWWRGCTGNVCWRPLLQRPAIWSGTVAMRCRLTAPACVSRTATTAS
jgi:hypothetical protein